MWESIATDVCQCSARPKMSESSYLDKENVQPALSPVKNEDLSLYGNPSASAVLCTGTSPNHCNHNIISRRPLEDYDPNSRDSGYVTNYHGEGGKLCTSPSRMVSFGSTSIGSMEDEFFEDISDIEPLDDNLPQDFSKLITGPLAQPRSITETTSPKDIRPFFPLVSPTQIERSAAKKARCCLFKPLIASRPFKRPEPSQEPDTPTNTKKKKIGEDDEVASVPNVQRPVLQRVLSATEESIMDAVHKSSEEPLLIGDFSKPFCLPLTPGRHQDLKSITSSTLAQLIMGDFSINVATFKVIDCRYPYEYEGGHIVDAVNVYTREQCMSLLKNFGGHNGQDSRRRDILVFHCEFSSERGPNLYRYLREQDRQLNLELYPSLHYPELYLLEGGYKNFFEHYSNMCIPIAYKAMLHPEHENDLRYFKLKSKTWNVDTRHRQCRANLKTQGWYT